MNPLRDEFLSEEDLDLRNLSEEELVAYWNLWLEQAQQTNDADAHAYTHGVFVGMEFDADVDDPLEAYLVEVDADRRRWRDRT
jgi:hypothetical protein